MYTYILCIYDNNKGPGGLPGKSSRPGVINHWRRAHKYTDWQGNGKRIFMYKISGAHLVRYPGKARDVERLIIYI